VSQGQAVDPDRRSDTRATKREGGQLVQEIPTGNCCNGPCATGSTHLMTWLGCDFMAFTIRIPPMPNCFQYLDPEMEGLWRCNEAAGQLVKAQKSPMIPTAAARHFEIFGRHYRFVVERVGPMLSERMRVPKNPRCQPKSWSGCPDS
jgi:hypothetical protein